MFDDIAVGPVLKSRFSLFFACRHELDPWLGSRMRVLQAETISSNAAASSKSSGRLALKNGSIGMSAKGTVIRR